MYASNLQELKVVWPGYYSEVGLEKSLLQTAREENRKGEEEEQGREEEKTKERRGVCSLELKHLV